MRRQMIGPLLVAATMVLFAATKSSAQLPSPSPCCAPVCNGTTSIKCGAPAVGSNNVILSGCVDVGPLACEAGEVLNASGTLINGCTCLLSPQLCLVVDLPAGTIAPANPLTQCSAQAIAGCTDAGNVVETPNDPACGGGGGCNPPCAANETCVNGTCQPNGCTTDADCPDAQVCHNGTCVCPANTEECNGNCVDEKNDPNNCGACGNVCGSGTGCQNGQCVECSNHSGGGDNTNPGGGGNPAGCNNPHNGGNGHH